MDIGHLFHRYVTILHLIPKYPRYISTTQLLLLLEKRGLSTSHRSLQRDLGERLSLYFPIICDSSARPYRWSLDAGYELGLPKPRTDQNLLQVSTCKTCSAVA